jgi:hypothetical protein
MANNMQKKFTTKGPPCAQIAVFTKNSEFVQKRVYLAIFENFSPFYTFLCIFGLYCLLKGQQNVLSKIEISSEGPPSDVRNFCMLNAIRELLRSFFEFYPGKTEH